MGRPGGLIGRASRGALGAAPVGRRGGRAVDHVSCSLEAGRMTSLIGPNWAGKTTLCGVIAGQHAADDGTV
ncbi:MAG: ATP-binding cassette domain-containing protein, partial [Betaproteobacteria bacterium]